MTEVLTLPVQKGQNMQATGEFRWFAEFVQMPLRLQQAWRVIETGEVIWRDIPTVYGKQYA